MNLLVVSRSYEPTQPFVSAFLESRNLQVAYLASRTEVDRKTFERTKTFYRELGDHELEYFDLDQEFVEETLKKIKRCHAIHLADGSSSFFQWCMLKTGFASFIKDYFYIGGKVIGCGVGAITLAPSISLGREFSDPLPEGDSKGLSILPFEVFPFYQQEPGLDLRLKTLSSQNGGRVIYAVPHDSAISLDRNQIQVHPGVKCFYQYQSHEFTETTMMPLEKLKVCVEVSPLIPMDEANEAVPNETVQAEA